MFAVAIIALSAGVPSLAQINSSRVASDLSLVVDGGSQVAVMPVITETAQGDLLTYDFAAGEIQLAAGVLSPDYDEPLFCFDMASPQSVVSLQVSDPNGHIIIDDFSLKVALDYILSEPSTLEVNPGTDQQCFYRSDQGVFGLFGQESPDGSVDGDIIKLDRFEVDRSIELEFQDVPTFVTPGETVTYDLVVTNTGSTDLEQVALQELFPENLGVYAAALSVGSWECSAIGDAVCPAPGPVTEPLRVQDTNAGGADITVGDSLTFSIERTVNANSITGEAIRLSAGTVTDPVASDTPFAVAEALMTVIGESSGLNISATEAVADGNESSTITVTVLDANQNPVPNETVTFDSISPSTSAALPTSGDTDVNGEVVFDSGTTTDAGEYTASFSTDTFSQSGSVTFSAGAPAAMNAYTSVNNVVADGSSEAEFTVTVQDANNNVMSGVGVDVSDNGGLTTITPATAFTDVDGYATFTATSGETGSFTATFAVSGAGTSSATATFEPGQFDEHAFVQDPSDMPDNLVAGEQFTVTVELVDASGNRLTDDSTSEVFLELNGPSTQDYGSVIVDQGLATFSGLTVDNPGTGYTLRSTVPGLYFEFRDTGAFDVDAQ
jgi:uncharacterized repeat protein (TIGR01451 family)